VIAGNNQAGDVFKYKFGWTDKDADKSNTFISSAGILGLIIGSLLSTKIVVFGRRIIAILFSFFIILVVSAMLIWPGFYMMCIGRVMTGFSAGVLITCVSLTLSETIPAEYESTLSCTINLGIVLGLTVCMFSGLPLTSLDPI
jgi:MFS family permease